MVETGGKKFLLWYCHSMGRPRPLLKNYAISLPLASGMYIIYYYQFQCFPSLRIFWRTDNSTVARVNVNPFHPITRDPSSAARPSRTRQCQRLLWTRKKTSGTFRSSVYRVFTAKSNYCFDSVRRRSVFPDDARANELSRMCFCGRVTGSFS